MVAEYDPDDPQQVAYLDAAFLGVNRVYPQTVLDPLPVVRAPRRHRGVQPVAMLIHVDIPPSVEWRRDAFSSCVGRRANERA